MVHALFSSLPRTLVTARDEVVAGVAGIGTLLLLWLSGTAAAERDLLDFIGFDPPRAALLSAFSAGAVAALVAALMSGRRRVPCLMGVAALVVFFSRTMARQLHQAIHAHGDAGAFDPAGFVASGLALVVAGLVVGWASATLGREVRASLVATLQYTRARIRNRGGLGVVNRRLAWSLAVAIAVMGSASVVADMLNYSPDALYRVGPAGAFGMFNVPAAAAAARTSGSASRAGPGNRPGPTSADVAAPENGSPFPSASQRAIGGSLTPSLTPSQSPQEQGPIPPGSVDAAALPPFWTGGASKSVDVRIYVPGDYASGGGPYPVIYAVPWSFDSWEKGTQIKELLDAMVSTGQIPPTIVVFAALAGGPYPDTECVNSYDGRSRAETFLAASLPTWVDSHYRTIADAQHRTIAGFSEGGYCSAMLLLGHPDVFRQGISLGGYYTAALRGPQTVNAWQPFGPSGAGIDSHSPLMEARRLDSAIRSRLFLVVSGIASQPFYGDQYVAFENELVTDGIPHELIDTPEAHSWPSVRADLPAALRAVAGNIARATTGGS